MNEKVENRGLEFSLFSQQGDSFPGRLMNHRYLPYRVTIFILDLSIICLFFLFASERTLLDTIIYVNAVQLISFFVITTTAVAYIFTYDLYSYHSIFSAKIHLGNLLKAVGWCFLTFVMIAVARAQSLFADIWPLIILLILLAVSLILNSKFFWNNYKILKSCGICILITGVASLIPEQTGSHGAGYSSTLFFYLSICVAAILISRHVLIFVVFKNWLRQSYRCQVAIIGSDNDAKTISSHILDQDAPFWISGFVGPECSLEADFPKSCLGHILEFPDIVRKHNINEIIITDESIDKKTLIALLDYCTSKGITVWFVPRLLPIIGVKLNIDHFCGLPMVKLSSQKHRRLFRKIKYGLDALVTIILLVLLLPILIVIALAIKLDSKGPIFYKAVAIGKHGKNFKMYKFRSMQINNNNEIHLNFVTQLIKGLMDNESRNRQALKITDDPRITFVGRFLRRYSLDELPQLINVLRGEMSLVGPRPCLPYEYELYEDWHKKRASVRPGISGLWQVVGRSSVKFEDMVLLDLYYIYNRSLLLDLNILYKTVFAVIRKEGAY